MVAEIKNFAPTRTGRSLKWIESQNLTMAGLDPATQQPRVGAANDSLRSRTLACWVTGSEADHGEEFASVQSENVPGIDQGKQTEDSSPKRRPRQIVAGIGARKGCPRFDSRLNDPLSLQSIRNPTRPRACAAACE